MGVGVGKSGSPAPKPITGRPAALSALAFASTARVADSAMAPMRSDTRAAMAPSFQTEVSVQPGACTTLSVLGWHAPAPAWAGAAVRRGAAQLAEPRSPKPVVAG